MANSSEQWAGCPQVLPQQRKKKVTGTVWSLLSGESAWEHRTWQRCRWAAERDQFASLARHPLQKLTKLGFKVWSQPTPSPDPLPTDDHFKHLKNFCRENGSTSSREQKTHPKEPVKGWVMEFCTIGISRLSLSLANKTTQRLVVLYFG